MRIGRFALFVALAFLTAHALAILLVHCPGLISNLFVLVPPLVAVLATSEQSRQAFGQVQTKWRLLSVGIAFWAIGQVLYTYCTFFLHERQVMALQSDFYFFLWGVPVLLAIAVADDEGDSALLLSLDTIQAALAAALIHIELFSVKADAGSHAIAVVPLMYLYMSESIILVAAAATRLFARPAKRELRFHRVLVWFLCSYALISIPANYADAVLKIGDGTLGDVLWDIPFLILMLCALPHSRLVAPGKSPEASLTVTRLLVANFCPSFFSIAVLVLAAHVSRQRPVLGASIIVVSLSLYSARAALLQTRYLQAQFALAASREELREANIKLQDLTLQDPLTGVANRRHFEQVLEAEWKRALRTGGQISILMMDVDHFKQINDRYGHPCGDTCLVAIIKALRTRVRRNGELLARYGGEEFVAILPETGSEEASRIAEEMLVAVREISAEELFGGSDGKLTISIGVASRIPSFEESPSSLIASADVALYTAKQRGRDRLEQAARTEAMVG
jgi:diguanylate cyclase (GGDEF)-like protein